MTTIPSLRLAAAVACVSIAVTVAIAQHPSVLGIHRRRADVSRTRQDHPSVEPAEPQTRQPVLARHRLHAGGSREGRGVPPGVAGRPHGHLSAVRDQRAGRSAVGL